MRDLLHKVKENESLKQRNILITKPSNILLKLEAKRKPILRGSSESAVPPLFLVDRAMAVVLMVFVF
jgi:hypothetical protein